MARPILVNWDFNKNEIQNARVQNLASAPGTPVIGQIYFDTTLNKYRCFAGAPISAWVNLDGSDIPDSTVTSAKIADLTIVNGDISASAAIALSKLATDPLARGNHTGTQLASTISDFTETAQDAVGAALAAGTHGGGIGVVYDDAGNAISVSLANNEAFQDIIGAFLGVVSGNSGITVTYDDANNRMTFAVTDSPTVAGATPAQLRDRGTHTGTQAAATISDLAAVVQAYALSSFAVPGADVAFNNKKITGLADPTNPQDAATKNYVDLARQGIRLKDSVRVATTAPITLSSTQTIDGIAVQVGDRVLVKDQASAPTNGIYVVAAGAWTRATDSDTAAEMTDGVTVWVNEGTANANKTYSQINTITTLGTDAQSWVVQGAATSYTGGNGISVSGSVISINAAGAGIIADGTSVRVDPAVVTRKFTQVLSTSATSYVITHNLANQWVQVGVFETSGSYRQVEVDVELTDANTVTLRFATAPTSNAYRVVIQG